MDRSLETPYQAPRSELERLFVRMWEEALEVRPVGVDDDFFDLGGDSLVAIQLASRISDTFEIALSASTPFATPTVRALATAVEQELRRRAAQLSADDGGPPLAGPHGAA